MEDKTQGISNDWPAVWIGPFIFILSLGAFIGADVFDWGITTVAWNDLSKSREPFSATGTDGAASLVITYVVLLTIMGSAPKRSQPIAQVHHRLSCGIKFVVNV